MVRQMSLVSLCLGHDTEGQDVHRRNEPTTFKTLSEAFILVEWSCTNLRWEPFLWSSQQVTSGPNVRSERVSNLPAGVKRNTWPARAIASSFGHGIYPLDPSGNLTTCHGTWPFPLGKSSIYKRANCPYRELCQIPRGYTCRFVIRMQCRGCSIEPALSFVQFNHSGLAI
jgi:hypothetical protein